LPTAAEVLFLLLRGAPSLPILPLCFSSAELCEATCCGLGCWREGCRAAREVEACERGSVRQHTSAYVSIRQHTSAYISIRLAFVSIRQHTCLEEEACERGCRPLLSYVSIRQHTSAYVSIRQHTCLEEEACERGCCPLLSAVEWYLRT
jgi:hypothetical protein